MSARADHPDLRGLRLRRVGDLGLRLPSILGLGLLGLLWGCGATPLSERYEAEHDLWSARRIERRIANQPDDPGPLLEQAKTAYAAILERYPEAGAGADSTERENLERVRASAVLGLARILRASNDIEGAVTVVAAHRMDAPWDLDATLRLHRELVDLLSLQGSPDTLITVLRSIIEELPPGQPNGQPIPLVLEAPLREVDLLEAVGRDEEAAARLDQADLYYAEVAARSPGTPLEVAADLHRSNVFLRQNRYQEAEQTLARAFDLPAAGPSRPQILLTQALVRQRGLEDYAGAIHLLRKMVRRYPDDPRAAGALLQIAIAFRSAGQPDSALAAFDLVEKRYPKNIEIASQARFLGATVLEMEGRWDEALRRYRSVTTDFRRTSSGLLAPLQIASYYERQGEKEVTRATLEAAAVEYQRIARDLGSNPASRALVLSALDHLADVWTRLGEWDKAVQALLHRAEDYPRDYRSPLAYVRAAAIQEEQLRDRDAAIATLEKLTQRYPDLPLSLRAQSKIEMLRGSS